MESLGRHCILNLEGCSFQDLNDHDYIVEIIQESAKASGATILKTVSHKFYPQGITALCLLSESHISIHTYPELGKCFADVYTCGSPDPKLGCDYMIDKLKPSNYKMEMHLR